MSFLWFTFILSQPHLLLQGLQSVTCVSLFVMHSSYCIRLFLAPDAMPLQGPLHTAQEKFENPPITGHLRFVFEENSGREVT